MPVVGDKHLSKYVCAHIQTHPAGCRVYKSNKVHTQNDRAGQATMLKQQRSSKQMKSHTHTQDQCPHNQHLATLLLRSECERADSLKLAAF